MKKLLSIVVIALIGAFVMSSCTKKYETEPLKTVTVKGQVKAWLDLTASEIQNVPSNKAKLIFRTNAQNLCQDVDAAYTYNELQYEVDVVDGEYSIDLPAVNFQSVTYTITPVEFVSQQKQSADISKEKVYSASPTSVSVREGEAHYRVDVTYN